MMDRGNLIKLCEVDRKECRTLQIKEKSIQ